MASSVGSVSALTEIYNTMGVHLRPASRMVQIGNRYPDCEIELSKDGQAVNGKSLLSVIMLAAGQGCTLEIKVTGDGCEQLLSELLTLIQNKFDEE